MPIFVNIPSWVKGIIWLVGALVSLWAVIDAIRGYWGMYKEYGPSVHAAAYHWWATSPVRITFAIAVIGAIVAALAFYLFASRSPSAMPEKQPANPPISVTGFSIDPKPYEIGKIIHINLRINSLTSGLKLRGGFKVWLGQADDAALSIENRQRDEELLWRQFAANPPAQKIPLSWIRGDSISTCDGPVLTKEDADRLNGANGIVYIMGQIDYGDGALDFGGYIRTATPQVGTFSVEHNGPAKSRFFKN